MAGIGSLVPRLISRPAWASSSLHSRSRTQLLAPAFAPAASSLSSSSGSFGASQRAMSTARTLRPRLAYGTATRSLVPPGRRYLSDSSSVPVTAAASTASGSMDAAAAVNVPSVPLEPLDTVAAAAANSTSWGVSDVLLAPAHLIGDLLLATPTPSYTLSIVVLTIILRTAITVPVQIWRRKRTELTEATVVPEMQRANEKIAIRLVGEHRKSGKGYDEYMVELKKQLADYQYALHKKYGTHPLKLIGAPVLVAIPLLITCSQAIRYAIDAPGSALAAERFAWLADGLGEADPTMILPVIGGVMAYASAEFQTRQHKKVEEALDETTKPEGPEQASPLSKMAANGKAPKWTIAPAGVRSSSQRIGSSSSGPPRPSTPPPRATGNRKLSTTTPILAASLRPRRAVRSDNNDLAATSESMFNDVDIVPGAAKNMTTLMVRVRRAVNFSLKAFSVLFMVVGQFVPSGIVIYWTASMAYTLIQNMIFARIDEAKYHAKKALKAKRREEMIAARVAAGNARRPVL